MEFTIKAGSPEKLKSDCVVVGVYAGSDLTASAKALDKAADGAITALLARGELDEALRIRINEEMPVYEKLGDARSQAATLGQIAQIHLARGELDQALEMNGQRRPIAERLGDIDSLAHIHYLDAKIHLKRGDHERGALQTIFEDLAAAYKINVKLGRPDGIGEVGSMLAQVMAMGGHRDEALDVLVTAEAAHRKLGNAQGVAHVAELRQLIGGAG